MAADVQLIPEKGTTVNHLKAEIEGIVDEKLASIRSVTEDIIQGRVTLF
jgi:S-adenosylmethionine synthetase